MTFPEGARTRPPHDTPRAAEPPSAEHGLAGAKLVLVAAVAANGIIGRDNALPWRLPGDLRHFREITTGHAIIMGRRTWQSLGRALSARQNIVVTRQASFRAEAAEIANTLEAAIAMVRRPAPAFVIGGEKLFVAALPLADAMHLTEIARDYEGDTRFPPVDWSQWTESGREHRDAEPPEGVAYDFATYRRAAP